MSYTRQRRRRCGPSRNVHVVSESALLCATIAVHHYLLLCIHKSYCAQAARAEEQRINAVERQEEWKARAEAAEAAAAEGVISVYTDKYLYTKTPLITLMTMSITLMAMRLHSWQCLVHS